MQELQERIRKAEERLDEDDKKIEETGEKVVILETFKEEVEVKEEVDHHQTTPRQI